MSLKKHRREVEEFDLGLDDELNFERDFDFDDEPLSRNDANNLAFMLT